MRLDDELDALLSREAELENRSRSELVREALADWIAHRERQRFIAQLTRAARSLDADESRALAAEALPLDNEALLAAEPRAAFRSSRRGAGRRR